MAILTLAIMILILSTIPGMNRLKQNVFGHEILLCTYFYYQGQGYT